MNACLTFLCLVALAVVGHISADTLSRAHRPMGISEQQFHDNCVGEDGRYGALNGQVVCTLPATDVQVICQFETVLGNCLWTGPIRAGTLMALLGSPAAAETS